jgi:hypothetical protein
VIERARQVLALLEGEGAALVPALASALGGRARGHGRRGAPEAAGADQLGLFAATSHPVVDTLRTVDVNALTPLAALQLVAELAERARA